VKGAEIPVQQQLKDLFLMQDKLKKKLAAVDRMISELTPVFWNEQGYGLVRPRKERLRPAVFDYVN
jgi:hypothetical protein